MKTKRTLSQKLAAILLAVEAVVFFFFTIVAAGLKVLPLWQAIVLGAVLALVFLVTAGLVKYPFAMIVAWGLQLVMIACGFLVKEMFIVGFVFLLLWSYSIIKAKQIEDQNQSMSQN